MNATTDVGQNTAAGAANVSAPVIIGTRPWLLPVAAPRPKVASS